uniref:Uncharacterized protein n=1 Tax=Amphimedon queenslandica TaxID=400682 RepID=A0A1X7TZV9_AMPQE
MKLQQELEAHILNVLDSGLVPNTAVTVDNPWNKRARCLDQTIQTPKKRKDPDLSVRIYSFC